MDYSSTEYLIHYSVGSPKIVYDVINNEILDVRTVSLVGMGPEYNYVVNMN